MGRSLESTEILQRATTGGDPMPRLLPLTRGNCGRSRCERCFGTDRRSRSRLSGADLELTAGTRVDWQGRADFLADAVDERPTRVSPGSIPAGHARWSCGSSVDCALPRSPMYSRRPTARSSVAATGAGGGGEESPPPQCALHPLRRFNPLPGLPPSPVRSPSSGPSTRARELGLDRSGHRGSSGRRFATSSPRGP